MNFIKLNNVRINLDAINFYRPSMDFQETVVFYKGVDSPVSYDIPVTEFDKLVKEASNKTDSLEYAIKRLTETINALPSRMPTSVRMRL